MKLPKLRPSERLLVWHFAYVAIVASFFPLGIRGPALLALGAFALLAGLARPAFDSLRDWVPLGLTLVAYREMDWFTPKVRDRHLENVWILFDRRLLDEWRLRALIEGFGSAIPAILELSYLLVYAVGPVTVGILYFYRRRDLVSRALLCYLAGTLLAYALFPYFPSEPPRTAFPYTDLPQVITALRHFNLTLLGGYGIHSSVFPSAHVSSAFSAAWALLLLFPQKKWVGRSMLTYAVLVSIATVYGRYHYAFDALAGFGVSLTALVLAWNSRKTILID